jgi:hypothetical protein
MIYPTVLVRTKIHAVKDEITCLCGTIHNRKIPRNKKKLLKKIQFKDTCSISCKKCMTALQETEISK